MKIIYLPIEIPERELDSKLLLAFEALNRGYKIVIGDYSKVHLMALKLKSGFFLYKAMTDHNAKKYFKPLVDSGVYCGSLDEEGLVWPSLDYYEKTRIGNGESIPLLSAVFTWGKVQKEFIVDKFPGSEKKIFATGNPRFDLLREPFNSIYNYDSKNITDFWGGYVLINTNFGPANFSRVFGRSWLEHMSWAGIIKSEFDFAYMRERSKYYEILFADYVEMIFALAKQFSSTNIVLRPHPSEDHENWRNKLKGIDNVHVVFEGGSVAWIKGARCVIHTGCTTGIEAFVLGTPVVRYNRFPKNNMESHLPNDVSVNYSDLHDLLDGVGLILDKKTNSKMNEMLVSLLSSMAQNTTGKFAYKNILDVIDTIPIKSDENISLFNNYYFYVARLKGLVRICKSRVVRWIKKDESTVMQNAVTQRFRGIKHAEISDRLVSFSELAKQSTVASYRIKSIGENMFIIEKN